LAQAFLAQELAQKFWVLEQTEVLELSQTHT